MRRSSRIVAAGYFLAGVVAGVPATAAPVVGEPGTEPIFRCVVDYLRVDGLPLVQHSWCTRKRAGGPIIPLLSLEGEGIVFGIRPWSAPAAPPIPKHQRPLE